MEFEDYVVISEEGEQLVDGATEQETLDRAVETLELDRKDGIEACKRYALYELVGVYEVKDTGIILEEIE